MKQSTKDFLAFTVLPIVGLLGGTYLINKKGPRVARITPAGWNVVMCSPYDGHSVCVVQSQYEPSKYSFTVDGGPTMPDDREWPTPTIARQAAEDFIDDMT